MKPEEHIRPECTGFGGEEISLRRSGQGVESVEAQISDLPADHLQLTIVVHLEPLVRAFEGLEDPPIDRYEMGPVDIGAHGFDAQILPQLELFCPAFQHTMEFLQGTFIHQLDQLQQFRCSHGQVDGKAFQAGGIDLDGLKGVTVFQGHVPQVAYGYSSVAELLLGGCKGLIRGIE